LGSLSTPKANWGLTVGRADAATDTAVPREVAEACLAHTIGSVERAYRRSDLFDKRRKLMELWATMLTI
jgi:hypothetical protein